MTTTTNLKLSTPAHGANVDTWDADPINNNSTILDSAFGGVTSKALTNVNVTLTATEAQAATLRLSGALSGDVIINVSAIIKSWHIDNLTTGAFVVTISGGSGNVVGVPQGEIVEVVWDGTNCKFINLGRVGSYWDYAGAAVPAWVTACTVPPYLPCDGTTFSAVTYPYLNGILGTTTLPDLRGRARFNLNGGTGRITTAVSGIDGDTRFSAGGAQSVVLVQANLPNVNFTVTDPGHVHGSGWSVPGTGYTTGVNGTAARTLPGQDTASATTGISVASGGSGTATNKMPPAQISGVTMIRAA